MKKTKSLESIVIGLLVALVISFIQYASLSNYGYSLEGDLSRYSLYFEINRSFSYLDTLSEKDPVFYLLAWLFSQFVSFVFFISALTGFFYFSLSFAYSYLLRVSVLYLFPLLIFSTWYFAYNNLTEVAIRQGLAVATLFLSGFYFGKGRASYLKIFVASLFHIATIFYIPVIFLCMRILRLSSYMYIWSISAFLYVTETYSILVKFIPYYSIDFLGYYGGYINSLDIKEYVTGFSLLKFIMSAFPVLLLIWKMPRRIVMRDSEYFMLFRIYLIANSLGLAFSPFAYYDRILIFSWALIPIILIPFFNIFINSIMSWGKSRNILKHGSGT